MSNLAALSFVTVSGLAAPSAAAGVLHPESWFAAVSVQQDDVAARVRELDGLVQRGELERAIEVGRALVADHDDCARGWHFLGIALHFSGDVEGALAAHVRAAGFPATATHGAYNAACASALLGRKDEAFGWLERALAAGFDQPELLDSDSDLATLRDDPRFAKLRPGSADQSQPFVEAGVRILHESFGRAANDQYGWVARALGDLDGDGASDFASTAPFAHELRGEVRVLSGKTGAVLFEVRGEVGDLLGWCVGAASDFDGDGVLDLFAGAPGTPQEAVATGALVVFSGKDGAVLRRFVGEAAGDGFGTCARSVGDHDGDGRAELIVAAPRHDGPAGADAGRVYLIDGAKHERRFVFDGDAAGDRFGSGEIAGFATAEHSLIAIGSPEAGSARKGAVSFWSGRSGERLRTFAGTAHSNNLGWFVSLPGDVDRDGVPDVLATDWHDVQSGPGAGRVWISSGADGSVLHTLGGRVAGECFGIGACDAGDLDRDGWPDFAIGAWQHGSAAKSGGRIYLVSGRHGLELGRITCRLRGDTLGFDSTSLGDVDGDGVPDLLVTAAWNAKNGAKSGRTYVLSGVSCLAR